MEKRYETERLILKTLSPEEAHKSLYFYEYNDDFFEPYEPIRPAGFYTLEFHKRSLTLELEATEQLETLRLWLFLKEDKDLAVPIGNFAFNNIVRGCFLSCFLGYKVGKDFLRQGYMTEALTEGLRIIFDDYKLHRVEANVMPSNTASIALTKKLGFREEGLAKDYLKINGQWEDHIHMVLLNDNV